MTSRFRKRVSPPYQYGVTIINSIRIFQIKDALYLRPLHGQLFFGCTMVDRNKRARTEGRRSVGTTIGIICHGDQKKNGGVITNNRAKANGRRPFLGTLGISCCPCLLLSWAQATHAEDQNPWPWPWDVLRLFCALYVQATAAASSCS